MFYIRQHLIVNYHYACNRVVKIENLKNTYRQAKGSFVPKSSWDLHKMLYEASGNNKRLN